MKKKWISLLLSLTLLCLPLLGALAEEETQLTILTPNQTFDMNSDYIHGLLEEHTGFKVNYEYLPAENPDQQLAMMIASGVEYDVINLSPIQYQTLLSQGALMPLDELLEKYPIIKEKITDLGWQYVTAKDGKIYGVPSVDDAVYTGGIGYRADLFEELGLTEPNTVDEFYELLTQIKEKTDMIPLTGNRAVEEVIASGFGIDYPFVIKDGKLVSYLRLEGMKEYLAFMNKCYEEGLIDIDWPLNTGQAINEKISSSQAMMTYMAHWVPINWVNALIETKEDVYFKNIIPLEDSQGKRHINLSNTVSRVAAIPVSYTENADKTMEMIASRISDETYWLFNAGIEGTHYTKDEKGIPSPILPIFTEDINNGHEFQLGRNQYVHPISWMARVKKTDVQWGVFYDSNSKAAQYSFIANPLAYASFDAYTKNFSALDTMCQDYFIQVISGAEDLDKTYDEFVESWENAGGLEIEEEGSKWIEENKALVEATLTTVSPYSELFGYVVE